LSANFESVTVFVDRRMARLSFLSIKNEFVYVW